MVAVGILYLLFEETILEQSKSTIQDRVRQMSWPISRTVIGTQVSSDLQLSNLFLIAY